MFQATLYSIFLYQYLIGGCRRVTLKYEKKRKEAKRSEKKRKEDAFKQKEAKRGRRRDKQKYLMYAKVTLVTKQMPPSRKHIIENIQ